MKLTLTVAGLPVTYAVRAYDGAALGSIKRLAALALVIAAACPAAAGAATPTASVMGFGFRSFRSPAAGKPPPHGAVRSGGTLRGCPRDRTLHVYLAFRHMRRGLRLTLAWGDEAHGGHPKFTYPWRFTNESTGRAWYPPALNAGFALASPVELGGRYDVSVSISGRRRASGHVEVVSTCEASGAAARGLPISGFITHFFSLRPVGHGQVAGYDSNYDGLINIQEEGERGDARGRVWQAHRFLRAVNSKTRADADVVDISKADMRRYLASFDANHNGRIDAGSGEFGHLYRAIWHTRPPRAARYTSFERRFYG